MQRDTLCSNLPQQRDPGTSTDRTSPFAPCRSLAGSTSSAGVDMGDRG